MQNSKTVFALCMWVFVLTFAFALGLHEWRRPQPLVPPSPVPTAVERETQPRPALEVLNSKPTKCAIDQIGTRRKPYKNWVFRCTGKEEFPKDTLMGGYTALELEQIAEKARRKPRSRQDLISENNRPMPRGARSIELISGGGSKPTRPMVPCSSPKADRSRIFRPELKGPWLCEEK
jgi:hypothetical protein